MIRQEAKRDFTSEIRRRVGRVEVAWLRDRDEVLDFSLKPDPKHGSSFFLES